MGYVFAKNDEISLIMPDWHYGKDDLFEIVFNDNGNVVGSIKFRYEVDFITGNIEYNIFEEYRGYGYAKKALKLFAKNVYKLSDEDIFISILPNNTASIRTAKGAGAVYERMVPIPKGYSFDGYEMQKYAYRFIIKNNGGITDENGKTK